MESSAIPRPAVAWFIREITKLAKTRRWYGHEISRSKLNVDPKKYWNHQEYIYALLTEARQLPDIVVGYLLFSLTCEMPTHLSALKYWRYYWGFCVPILLFYHFKSFQLLTFFNPCSVLFFASPGGIWLRQISHSNLKEPADPSEILYVDFLRHKFACMSWDLKQSREKKQRDELAFWLG